jgi:hypothetical protein
MMTGAADFGAAGTVLVGVSCALRMVSCGDAQELAVVGEFAVVVKLSGRAVVGLFGWSSDGVSLILGGVVGVVLR